MEMRVGIDRLQRHGRGRRPLAHAVPSNDRTRSALCGSSVRRTPVTWDAGAPDACPDCCAILVLRASA